MTRSVQRAKVHVNSLFSWFDWLAGGAGSRSVLQLALRIGKARPERVVSTSANEC